jgi:hypothetical protein
MVMKNIKVIFVCGFLLLSAVVGVLYLLRKRFPTSLTGQQQNTVLGPFSFVITLYAFLLGFTVVNLWQTFDQADRTAAKEAETAGVLYLLTDSFPESQSARRTLIHYVESVAQEEWPAMAGGNISPKTEALYIKVWQEVRGLVPTSAREQAIYAELLAKLGNLTDYRRDRILLIDGSIPSIMWWSILFGGLLLFVGLYYLGTGTRDQIVIDIIVLGMLFITLYLAVEFNSPFTGDLRVSPRAFQFIGEKMMQVQGGWQ